MNTHPASENVIPVPRESRLAKMVEKMAGCGGLVYIDCDGLDAWLCDGSDIILYKTKIKFEWILANL